MNLLANLKANQNKQQEAVLHSVAVEPKALSSSVHKQQL